MRTKSLVVLMVLFVLFSAPLHGVEFERIGPPVGVVDQIIAVPGADRVWLSVSAGNLYRSVDAAKSWSFTGVDWVSEISIHPVTARVVVVRNERRSTPTQILASTDRGQTFETIAELKEVLSRIVTSPVAPDWLVSTDNLLASTDGGRSWSRIGDSVFDPLTAFYEGCPVVIKSIESIALSPFDSQTIYAATGEVIVAGSCRKRVFALLVSHSFGREWTLESIGDIRWRLQPDEYFPDRVFAETPTGLKQLTSSGFQPLSGRQLRGTIISIPNHRQQLLIFNRGSEFLRSNDGGRTWREIERIFGKPFFQLKAMPEPAGALLATTAGGLYRRRSNDQWKEANKGFQATSITDADASQGNVYALIGRQFLQRSSDAGQTWQDLSLRFPEENFDAIAVNPQNADHLIVSGSDFRLGARVYVSRNGGRSWTKALISRRSNVVYTHFDPAKSNVVYLSTFRRIYKSIEGGLNPQLLPLQFGATRILFDQSDSNTLLFASCDAAYRSHDGGQTARLINQGLGSTDYDYPCLVEDIAPAGHPGRYILVDSLSKVYLTEDYGDHWIRHAGAGMPVPRGGGADLLGDQRLYAADFIGMHFYSISPAGIFESTNGGRNWHTISEKFGVKNGRRLFSDMTDPRQFPFYVVTRFGLFRSK